MLVFYDLEKFILGDIFKNVKKALYY